jgi:uncharacterized metal-binding protein
VLIYGCPVGCEKRSWTQNKIPVDRYVIVMELGIDKTHGLDIEDSDVETVVEDVKHSRPLHG